ncbi:VOC family protein [Sodalis sp. RH24]|uniref:VOC family protein n=1 Tax=unclassified Sodalis (in: enterobacteria) TaxID=2636512 RepID=UPI0039B5D997
MSQLTPVIDHAVINVDDHLDDARALFLRLGFQLTARGHHSMGSSNHLAIFGENYLELLGYEQDNTGAAKGLWQPPLGLAGLVWKTGDAGAAFRQLQACRLAAEPPTAFSRRVTLPDSRIVEARFCITRIDARRIPNGFSFFCQHLTPDAVWQPAWRQHPNGVQDLCGFVMVADDTENAMQIYAQLFGPQHAFSKMGGEYFLQAGKTRLRFITPEQARQAFIALPEDYAGETRMSALEFRVSSLAQVRAVLEKGDIRFSATHNRVVVSPAAAFKVTLSFRE